MVQSYSVRCPETRQKVLPESFYTRSPDEVARDLLGKTLVRILRGRILSGMIVEVEAYFGPEDPASRARKGGDLAKRMKQGVGRALIYGVHGKWLLNIVAHEKGRCGAVLLRALRPLSGIEIMKELRGVEDVKVLTNGPGKLTEAMNIDKGFQGYPLYLPTSRLRIETGIHIDPKEVVRSQRIGVREDLEVPMRFFIRGCEYVSKSRKPLGRINTKSLRRP